MQSTYIMLHKCLVQDVTRAQHGIQTAMRYEVLAKGPPLFPTCRSIGFKLAVIASRNTNQTQIISGASMKLRVYLWIQNQSGNVTERIPCNPFPMFIVLKIWLCLLQLCISQIPKLVVVASETMAQYNAVISMRAVRRGFYVVSKSVTEVRNARVFSESPCK